MGLFSCFCDVLSESQAPRTVPDMERVWSNAELLNKYMNKVCEESGRVFEAEGSNVYWLRLKKEPMTLLDKKEVWVAKWNVV